MADQKHEEMIARYVAAMEKESRERLAKSADLIAKFTAVAACKGVLLTGESYQYIQTIGIVAKAPGIAQKLLGPVKTERDGLLSFDEIASQFPPSPYYEGCFAGPDFILMAHPCYRPDAPDQQLGSEVHRFVLAIPRARHRKIHRP